MLYSTAGSILLVHGGAHINDARVMRGAVQGTCCHLTKYGGGLPALSFQGEGGAAGQDPSLLVMADEYTSDSMYVWLRGYMFDRLWLSFSFSKNKKQPIHNC